MGIEPTPSAWKAEVLPLNYTRLAPAYAGLPLTVFRLDDPLARGLDSALTVETKKPIKSMIVQVVEGEGFEPSKA